MSTTLDTQAKFLREEMKKSRKFSTFTMNFNGDITAIVGRTLEVKNLTEEVDKPYFQAWVDGCQDDGVTHNEAVKNALERAKMEMKS